MTDKPTKHSQPAEVAETEELRAVATDEGGPTSNEHQETKNDRKPTPLREKIDSKIQALTERLEKIIKSKKFRKEVPDRLIVAEYRACLKELNALALKFQAIGVGNTYVPDLQGSSTASSAGQI